MQWLLNLLVALFAGRCIVAQDHLQKPLVGQKKPPNIIFFLTDDLDLHMDSLSYMPLLKKHLTDKGTSFNRHYCTVSLCCPSRASLWTGQHAHNTNVTELRPPWGGYPKFVSQGYNEDYLPVWLQAVGYSTYYAGKFLNSQSVDNYNDPHAAGWTGSDFQLDPHTYEYLNATFQRNHDPPVSYEGQYSTDVLADKAHGFLTDALDSETPFFFTIAPVAPHANVKHWTEQVDGEPVARSDIGPAVSAERHKHLFEDVTVPRTPNFNPNEPSGVSWISRLPQQNQTNVDYNDGFYRTRLQSLQSVDEMIDSVTTRLEQAGVLDNTYIFFSSDNGFTIGQHRRQPGKQSAFEEDVSVPLIVRGPGVSEGMATNIVSSHIDLAPTFLRLAGAETRQSLDGLAIPLHRPEIEEAQSTRQENVNIEHWGITMSEGKYDKVLHTNHTYKALRLAGQTHNLLYTVWCSGEHELYDLNRDPYQMHNLHALDHSTPYHPSSPSQNNTIPPTTLARLLPRLDTLLKLLKTCRGWECTHPWEQLHPLGGVHSLTKALQPRFDSFYEEQQERIRFEKCELGFIPESEGPVWDGRGFDGEEMLGVGLEDLVQGGEGWSQFV
ncbi:hypothetical protein MBLNU230_g8471t1 [Neophaeotheca triangularis]